jgi:hypothetical protein
MAVCGFLLGLFSAAAAAQRMPVPIIDYPDQAVMTGSGKPVTAEMVKDAIVRAANRQKWTMTYSPSGDRMLATLVVRNKHTVMVGIAYSADAYSLKYDSSINMNYRVQDGTPVIHPFYNTWVQNLVTAIQMELKQL